LAQNKFGKSKIKLYLCTLIIHLKLTAMPNHVTTILKIGGVSTKRLAEILNAIKGNEESNDDDKNDVIDFNRIIPMPKSLNITAGGNDDLALFMVTGKNVGHYRTDAEMQAEIDKMTDEEKAEAKKFGEAQAFNIKNYGHRNWYDWCCANWGTKWNAYNSYVEGNTITFETAWSTPAPVIRELSSMFPDATFSVEYADEDIGSNVGNYSYKGGKTTDEYQPEGDQAMAMALRIKGMDGECVKFEGEWHWIDSMDKKMRARYDKSLQPKKKKVSKAKKPKVVITIKKAK
jgi:hypothetical protein